MSGVDGTVYIADRVVEGSNIGNLFLFKLTDDIDVEIVSTNFGTVDYEKGEILINTVNITSTLLPENIVEIQAVPLSNDVLGRKELYLQLSTEKSNFTMRQDLISSGANVSGTRFDVQSSYSNGNKVRGAIVTSSKGVGKLVGYVNGQAYYGEFHTMPNGTKMTGSSHSVNSVQISDTLTFTPVDTSSTMTSSSSSSSSSSNYSSGY